MLLGIVLTLGSCKKDNVTPSGLYTPTASDVTANATLLELQQGKSLFVNRCAACHGLYTPDTYTSTNWKSILNSMASRAGLSSSESTLVLKYVTRGK